ncbi:conserved hypothetical protein [Gammaproteobacteria bacterium]
MMTNLGALYEKDFSAWAMRNAELLSQGQFLELDIPHLLEELGDMGSSERNELENRLVILLAHLLKWQFQYLHLSEKWREFDGRSWHFTIIEQRTRIGKRLRKSPGLKSLLTELITEAYEDAVELANKETQLPTNLFPETCPYTQTQILDDEYYPTPE